MEARYEPARIRALKNNGPSKSGSLGRWRSVIPEARETSTMNKPVSRLLTPDTVAMAARCLHSWHLECHGDPHRRRAGPPQGDVEAATSKAQRERLLQWLPGRVTPSGNGRNLRAGCDETLRLMKEGHPWITDAIAAKPGLWGRI